MDRSFEQVQNTKCNDPEQRMKGNAQSAQRRSRIAATAISCPICLKPRVRVRAVAVLLFPWIMLLAQFLLPGLSAAQAPGDTKWTFDPGPGISTGSAPAIGPDGTVYVASSNGVYALDDVGGVRWHSLAGESVVHSGISVGPDGVIYVPTGGVLYALAADGTQLWSYPTGAESNRPAIGPDGDLYFSDTDGLRALASDGSPLWDFSPSGINARTSVGRDGTIYIGAPYPSSTMYAVNPDGTEKWQFSFPKPSVEAPVIGADGTLYVTFGLTDNGADNGIYALTPSGTEVWHVFTPFISGPPALAGVESRAMCT